MATIVLKKAKEFTKKLWGFKVEFPYITELTEEGFVIVPDENGDDSVYHLCNFIVGEIIE